MKMVVILNNIRSNENVGSIFRTADATGVSKIFLVGYTPAPTDRFGRENKGLTKASLGAEKLVEWEKVETRLNDTVGQGLKSVTDKLREEGFKIVGIEQSPESVDYKLLPKDSNLALVFGNEVEGLSEEDLALCDIVAELPMHGQKESLNVAVSAGVALYSLL